MNDREQYTPGPASGARIRKDGEKWTLILVRELHHEPAKVWEALTDPSHLREWAPFDTDRNLGTAGIANLTWVGTGAPQQTTVTRANQPEVLEYGDIRWELEASGSGGPPSTPGSSVLKHPTGHLKLKCRESRGPQLRPGNSNIPTPAKSELEWATRRESIGPQNQACSRSRP